MTNVNGAKNVIDAAIDANVKKVLALSTDKAVNPVNLYGATKLCAEKLFVQGNAYSGETGPKFACARYGNVVGSRGSVVPIFRSQAATGGRISITDERMTRFWITLEQGVKFVINAMDKMHGGEIFVPKIPSMTLKELAHTLAPKSPVDIVGIRPGEKLHECLISEDEARHSVEEDHMYVILPEHSWWPSGFWSQCKKVESGFRFVSDTNTEWLTGEQLLALIGN
jgi:UDP-N-acetylglucosamine 4,6-dehydratase